MTKPHQELHGSGFCQTENPTYASFILYFHCTNDIWSIFYHSYLRLHTCLYAWVVWLNVCIKMDNFFCWIKWVKTTVCLFIFLCYEWGTPRYGYWAIFIHASPNECLTTLQLWLKAVNGSQEMLKLLFCCFVTGEQLKTSNLYKFIGLNMFHIFFWSCFHSNFT